MPKAADVSPLLNQLVRPALEYKEALKGQSSSPARERGREVSGKSEKFSTL